MSEPSAATFDAVSPPAVCASTTTALEYGVMTIVDGSARHTADNTDCPTGARTPVASSV
ncbi:hypothetical protein [Paraburkholderia caledonica]|uniref:hypothetical protein n=1 Tax=Paraburkholderia caledonica TaxID=134536 RepID=UPI001FC94579|nr:hypothetical protein [Paraburkholderia caledonica]